MKIDTNDKKVLIFSDVHQSWKYISKIVKAEGADVNICLGDWFDSFFYDAPEDVYETACFLEHFLKSPNNHTLWGNHDLHYFNPFRQTICGGYDASKQSYINEIFGRNKTNIASKFKWYLQVDDYICTHAGIHQHHLPPFLDTKNIAAWLDTEGKIADIKLTARDPFWFYVAGKARGGSAVRGGLVWLDFNEEFKGIAGIKQIVGHTPSRESRIRGWKVNKEVPVQQWNNICIDCNLAQYIIITDRKIEIKKYADL